MKGEVIVISLTGLCADFVAINSSFNCLLTKCKVKNFIAGKALFWAKKYV